jgi:hypothetical protein
MLDPAMRDGFSIQERRSKIIIAAANKSPGEFLFATLAAGAVEIRR